CGGVRRARRRRRLDVRARPGVQARRGPDGHARRGGLEARRRAPGRPRGHPLLPTDRRARRAPGIDHPPPMSQLRNVAIVGFAQLPVVARDEHRMSTEMLYPVVREALAQVGVERDAIDYQVSASADYMDGRPFGFVAALDVMGSWPARQDLHLEMDGSFATYYAWMKIQTGEVDSAIVCGHGKTSEGEPERVLNLQLDPYYHAPLGLTPTATAALQASAYQARTGVTDADFAAIAARNRTAGTGNPETQLREAAAADALRQTPGGVEPLRRGYLAPVGESASCLVLAAEGKAESLCKKPGWMPGA